MSVYKRWFGFDRRERRASMLLVLLIVAVLIARISIPEQKLNIEYHLLVQDIETSRQTADTIVAGFAFDPNRAGYDTLVAAGLSRKQALNVISYRKAGGMFRQPEDIYRLFSVDSATAKKIIPYIIIGINTDNQRGKDLSYKKEYIVDLNFSDSSSLVKLPGIGPVYASRIIRYRHILGGYVTVDQLKEVYGITDSVFKKISGRLTTDTSVLRKILINYAGKREMEAHPYISSTEASSITELKEKGVIFRSVRDLTEKNIFSHEKAEKIRHYIDFSHEISNGR